MEIRKDVHIIEKKADVSSVKYIVRETNGADNVINNCRRVNTKPNKICYSGNIALNRDNIILEKNVTFWDNLNNTGVLVYQE